MSTVVGPQTESATIYDKNSGSSIGTYDVQDYWIDNRLSIGVAWRSSESTTAVTASPAIVRYDMGITCDNSTFSETLNPDPNNGNTSMTWYDLSWYSSIETYGWTGWYDTFNTRTWTKTHAQRTVQLTLNAYDLYSYDRSFNDVTNFPFTLSVPALTSYTVRYNANGGLASSTPAVQTKWYGETLTLSTTKPTKTGTTFKHWCTNSTGSGATYATGAQFNTNANTTLYAIWNNTATSYTIRYNANTGNASSTPAAQTKTHGVTLTLSTTKPTKTNATFYRWNTNSSGTGTAYAAGANFTLNANTTLYAIWAYTVKYNINGGTSGLPATQTKYHGTSLTITSTKPTKNNTTSNVQVLHRSNDGNDKIITKTTTRTDTYSFARWNTKTDGTGVNYTSGGSYTNNESITLYAQWNTITGTVSSITLASMSRHLYLLEGWYTTSNGSTRVGGAGDTYTPASSVTLVNLYANWTYNGYNITYNANGGTFTPHAHVAAIGDNNTTIAEGPIRYGYAFDKWNLAADGTGVSYSSGAPYSGPNDLTLYAIWNKIKTVEDLQSVTIEDNNKSISLSSISNIWNKITNKFYSKTLYEFTGTIDWSTIRTSPTTEDKTVTLSESCYSYQRLLIIGKTYYDTYVTATVINPKTSKTFVLKDNYVYYNSNLDTPEYFNLYLQQVPWKINGTQIIQSGTHGQYCIKDSTQDAQWTTSFDVKIVKVIGYNN